jgi:lipopolysaccharide exporter
LVPSDSLLKNMTHGGLWIFSLRITNRILGFVRTLILARLLAPSDFGLIGIAMLVMAALEMATETGFQTALIQKKGNISSYLDTAWTVSALRGIILFIALFFLSPVLARFFNAPQASLIIRVVALSTLLTSFGNICILYFQKELEFKKLFYYETTANFVDIIVSVSLAVLLKNVWALVWGGLAGHFVRFFLSYYIYPYKPRVKIGKREFRELFVFGRWMLGSSIVIFLVTQGDSIFVGRLLGITALGFYQMAFALSHMPTLELSNVISQVTFPAYSKLQDDLPRLKQMYKNAIQLNSFIITPIAIGICYFAADFTHIFLGDHWSPMVTTMQVFAIAGLMRSIAATSGSVLLAVNRPDLSTKLQVLRLLILILTIYPLIDHMGISGAAFSILMSILISSAGFVYATSFVTQTTSASILKILLLPLISSMMMIFFLLVFRMIIGVTGLGPFILHVLSGVILYLLSTHLLDMYFHYGIFRLIKDIISKI